MRSLRRGIRVVSIAAGIVTFAVLFAHQARAAQNGPASPQFVIGSGDYQGPNRPTLYDASFRPLKKLAVHIGEIVVDGDGTLYDAPYYYGSPGHKLYIVPPPYDRPTHVDFKPVVVSLATDPHTNVLAIGLPWPNRVEFYRKGALCAVVHTGGTPYSMVFDREGTLYFLPSTQSIASIAGQCKANSAQFYTLPKGNFYLGGIGITTNDNFIVGNSSGHEELLTFAHPVHGSFAPPIYVTSFATSDSFLCLLPDGKHLLAATGANRSATEITEYGYPNLWPAVARVKVSNAFECTTIPAVVP